MGTVLPDSSAPYASLDINGLTYQYTMEKDPTADAKVHVRNEDPINGGYVFEETDDWSGRHGATIRKYFRFPWSSSMYWGDGEFALEGEGEVKDPIMLYNYRLDIDEQMMKCMNPLADPSCPGFAEALAKYLENLQEPSADDPFYNEWVQANLSSNDQAEEDDLESEDNSVDQEEEEGQTLEARLGGDTTIEKLNTSKQDSILAELTSVTNLLPYYQVNIDGKEYKDVLVLKDNVISDNRRALSNLASDANHRKMVRSQYDREQ